MESTSASRKTAAEHFRLCYIGAVAQLIESYAPGDAQAAAARYPFLADYQMEIECHVGATATPALDWARRLREWEADAADFLPLRALREQGGLSELELGLLLTAGLNEEDARFGELFDSDRSGARRPTPGLLMAWWRLCGDGSDHVEAVRGGVQRLIAMGLLQNLAPEAPRMEWPLAVPVALWDAMRGTHDLLRGARFVARERCLPLARYLAPDELAATLLELPQALGAGSSRCLLVRGPEHNGRKTLIGGVARALHKNLLLLPPPAAGDEERGYGALAIALDAMPAFEARLLPGEAMRLPDLAPYVGPVAVALGPQGGVRALGRELLDVQLPMPGLAQRIEHFRAALPQQADDAESFAAALRITSGHARRAAEAARSYARLEQRERVSLDDLRRAARSLHAGRLETLAMRLERRGTLADLVCDGETLDEMRLLQMRCAHRETLAGLGSGHAVANAGVRALFSGSSGTGKTLAAQLLAASLDKDLYRLDLASTVNKYLGETEKNLAQVFALAEELDVVLLLDEGDSLLAQRTDVNNANDRYANLETNFLLQRIESYTGILLITTNAADRLDKAFARRMDTVVSFRLPDQSLRYDILQRHLPAHGIDDGFLREAAYRCQLSGGSLRNVALHTTLLALEEGGEPETRHLLRAFQREYRKTGASCPLKLAGVR
ncbi:ATP-binding protein [Solimonas soli]|uniref:ATP-binding protein n=1 Tax=Solimonas soli TaxID=413479 RepID=UPI0004AFA293|nr:ATP-binding protein [Solimonas soli]